MLKTTRATGDRVTPALADPGIVAGWDAADWDLAVRQARRSGLLARLASLLAARDLEGHVPARARAALESARILADKHRDDVARELRHIARALGGVAAPVILLKGASYAASGLPAAEGRLYGDIDILVPKRLLPAAEAALIAAGWDGVKQDAYDQSYYRCWMHEIPPLQHKARRTTIDVHHNIVPPTATHALDARRMTDWAVAIGGMTGFATLAPSDMVLHAAVHLFDDGEFANALRDLDDINRLLRHFSVQPDFWHSLTRRAARLGLGRPLYYALRYARNLLATPIPPRILAAPALDPPGRAVRGLMDFAFARALRPHHSSATAAGTWLALFFLYLRAHYLRMPLHLLLPHLLRKAVVNRLKPAAA